MGVYRWTQNRGFRRGAVVSVRLPMRKPYPMRGIGVVLRHYQNERKPYGGCRMAFFGWDSWTRTSDAGVKVLCLDRLGDIPSLRAIIPHPPPLCQDDIRCPAFFFGKFLKGMGSFFQKDPHKSFFIPHTPRWRFAEASASLPVRRRGTLSRYRRRRRRSIREIGG